MLVTPNRSILTLIPAMQVINHRKVRMREQADRRGRTAFSQWIHSFMLVSKKGVDKRYSIYMLYYMTTDKLKQLENEILKIKKELLELAPMRPGSLSLQYKVPAEKKGPYYQLSYTHKMKSRTQYVRPQWVDEIQKQIEVYKRFKKLVERWIDLSIDHSQTIMSKKTERGDK